MGLAVAGDVRLDLDKGVAAIAEGVGQHRDRLFHRLGVVPVTRMDGQQRQHRGGRQVLQLDVDPDLAETIALAFVEGEGDDEPVALGGQLGDRRQQPKIGISLGQVKPAQQVPVIGQPVGIIAVVGRQKPIPPALGGRDHPAQLAVAELLVADKIYAPDAGKFAFIDLEDEINSIFRQLDDFGLDRGPEPPMPAIKVEDAFDVILYSGAGVDDARAQLDLGGELLVVELMVSLEGDAVDDRVFDHLDDQAVADPGQTDVGKKAGREQRLERGVYLVGVPRVSRLDLQIRAHGFGLDPLGAFDPNIADRTAAHARNCGAGHRRGARLPRDRLEGSGPGRTDRAMRAVSAPLNGRRRGRARRGRTAGRHRSRGRRSGLAGRRHAAFKVGRGLRRRGRWCWGRWCRGRRSGLTGRRHAAFEAGRGLRCRG